MPPELLTNRHFVVLDEQSIEDDSCLIVYGGGKFDSEDEATLLRTDFYVAMNIVSTSELGVAKLGEGLDGDQVYGLHNLTW